VDETSEHRETGEHAAEACWRCVLPFDTDAPAFARGFELGAIWSLIDDPAYDEVVSTIHAENAEMILRMAEATRRPVRAVPVVDESGREDPDWLIATFGPVATAAV
jgi:hypothetical protein